MRILTFFLPLRLQLEVRGSGLWQQCSEGCKGRRKIEDHFDLGSLWINFEKVLLCTCMKKLSRRANVGMLVGRAANWAFAAVESKLGEHKLPMSVFTTDVAFGTIIPTVILSLKCDKPKDINVYVWVAENLVYHLAIFYHWVSP